MRPFPGLPSWRRQTPLLLSEPPPAFEASQVRHLTRLEELAAIEPPVMGSLAARLGVEALAARMLPVLLADGTAALFSLADHVGGDQARAMITSLQGQGFAIARPGRYAVPAALLLALAKGRVGQPAEPVGEGVSSTALLQVFHELLEWGVRQQASDIHLNVHLDRAESEVKYSVSGRYVAPERFRRMPTATLLELLSVAWMDIRGGNGAMFDPGLEQQGSLRCQVDGQPVLVRWASMAADAGPSVCLRLLPQRAGDRLPGLAELGYEPDQLALLDRVMQAEGGAVVFAGRVGSGKSTSLAALLGGLPATRKIITLEDPVEYRIPGAIHNSLTRHLNGEAHDTFAAKLRALKRSGMTDVLLGEVRDRETGRAFMDLAGAGINLYTTVHAPSAAGIPPRLMSDFIGVPPGFLKVQGMFRLLVYQALLPRLCMRCAVPASPGVLSELATPSMPGQDRDYWSRWLERLHVLYGRDAGTLRLRQPHGCPQCRQQSIPELLGYQGRIVAAEMVEPGRGLQGGRPALDAAVDKAFRGLIDPRDIESRFHAFATERLRRRSEAAARRNSGILPRRARLPKASAETRRRLALRAAGADT